MEHKENQMLILTPKSSEIIQKELGRSLQEVASEPLNVARGMNVKYLYPNRARGAVRAMLGKLLTPKYTEKMRADVSKFRLARKSRGIQRLLRHFR